MKERPSGGDAASSFVKDIEPFFYRKHCIYVDVGAYKGEVLKALAGSRIRIRHAHMIEPNPDSFQVLRNNLCEPDDAKYIHFHPHALGAGEKTIRMKKEGGKTRFVSEIQPEGAQEKEESGMFEVPVISLETFCRRMDLPHISLLKIDVEGYEEEVLLGATSLLAAQAIDVVYIEAGMNREETELTYHRKIEDILERHGYCLFKIYEQTNEWKEDSPKLRRANLAFMSGKFAAANPSRVSREVFDLEQKLADLAAGRDQAIAEAAALRAELERAEQDLVRTRENLRQQASEPQRKDAALANAEAERYQAIAQGREAEERAAGLEEEIRKARHIHAGEMERMVRDQTIAEKALAKIQARVLKLQGELQQVKSSLAWRITFPGRLIWRMFNKSPSKKPPAKKSRSVRPPSPRQASENPDESPGTVPSAVFSKIQPCTLSFAEQVKLLQKSPLMDGKWYRAKYPDVEMVNIHPARHYLKFGARLGRNPSKMFDTAFYQETYPDVAQSEMNPLVHYILHGEKEGRARKPKTGDEEKQARLEIAPLRTKLSGLGFTGQPLADLQRLLDTSPNPHTRAMAAHQLALWHLREKREDGCRLALGYIKRSRKTATALGLRRKLATIELLCHYFLGQEEEGRLAYQRAGLNGELDANVLLAWTNFQPTPDLRCTWINRILTSYAIPPVRLLPDEFLPPYDRLTAAAPLPQVPAANGPRVTVLLAAYDAAAVIPTALRSLQEQTWQNLEILVLDDCSSDNTCAVVENFAAGDPRIRLIRMKENRGAYVARNRGLDEATGVYVTIHDADDWSHPLKIETQVRFLEDHPEVIGCTSQQARASADLHFTRWTGEGHFIISNISSFMFRREPVTAEFGYWDTTRFSADKELIRRIRKKWRFRSIVDLKTGPLSFQRDSDTSIVADEVLGVNGFLFGARKEYLEAQEHFHNSTKDLKYSKEGPQRPFPIPEIMQTGRKARSEKRHFPLILASDFRMEGGSLQSCIQEVRAARQNGLKMGLFQMYRYDIGSKPFPELRDEIDGERIQMLTFGEEATSDLLLLRYPPILQHRQRYLPKISAERIKVIVNQPPMSDYTGNGVVRYDLKRCAENLRRDFGKEAEWHPIGPLVREALNRHHRDDLGHIQLSGQDWHNIIDIKGWRRSARPFRPDDGKGKLRIGRHSRDRFVKWPATKEEILAAYPPAEDVEIHVLGGARAPAEILGGLPDNWVVHRFNEVDPKKFLSELDVFVYFSHPDWVESFGRTIIEAMAVGVPVILPEVYRPLFKEAAIYGTVHTAADLARRIYRDRQAYETQVERALKYVAENFSYEMHIERLSATWQNRGGSECADPARPLLNS